MSNQYMEKPYQNAEGYSDPTAYQAIRNCLRENQIGYMPLVMIYSSEKDPEAKMVRKGACFALQNNCIPVSPQLICQDCFYGECRVDQVKARRIALILLNKCKEIWFVGEGDDAFIPRLIDKAFSLGIKLRFYSDSMKEVINV